MRRHVGDGKPQNWFYIPLGLSWACCYIIHVRLLVSSLGAENLGMPVSLSTLQEHDSVKAFVWSLVPGGLGPRVDAE